MQIARILHHVQLDSLRHTDDRERFAQGPGVQQHVRRAPIELHIDVRVVFDVERHDQQLRSVVCFLSAFRPHFWIMLKSEQTDVHCNPGLLNIVKQLPVANGTTTTTVSPAPIADGRILDVSSIVSLILWFMVILYTSFSSASKGDKLVQLGTGNKDRTDLDADGRWFHFWIGFYFQV